MQLWGRNAPRSNPSSTAPAAAPPAAAPAAVAAHVSDHASTVPATGLHATATLLLRYGYATLRLRKVNSSSSSSQNCT